MFSLILAVHATINYRLSGVYFIAYNGTFGQPGGNSVMDDKTTLDALRREIDAIDDEIHDLLMRRTEVVKKVRESKRDEKVKIRPAREARIVARLLERHRGPFPKRELIRIWREIIVATLSFEGPFSAAVYMPDTESSSGNSGGRRTNRWNLARDQYGSFTPMTSHVSVNRVIEAVRTQETTVGILPVPERSDEDPWWTYLIPRGKDMPRIIARLPITGAGDNRSGKMETLVICPVAPEASGRDRTYLAIEATEELGLNLLSKALMTVGLEPIFMAVHRDQTPPNWLHLAEVDGFVSDDDPRTERLIENLGKRVARVVSLGGYAIPFSDAELQSSED